MGRQPAILAQLGLCIFLLTLRCSLGTAETLAASDSDAGPSSVAYEVGVQSLTSTLSAMESALDYMNGHLDTVNLDGVIGVRMVEGQFGAILARHWTQLPAWLVTRMRSMQLLAAKLGDSTMASVSKRTPVYFAKGRRLISRHYWDTYYLRRRINADMVDGSERFLAELGSGDDNFSEKFSDDCIKEFSGLNGTSACTISKSCWDTMAASHGKHNYFLTHQLFYILNGIQSNCIQNLTSMALQSLRQEGAPASQLHQPLSSLMDRYCASIFAESLHQEELNFPVVNRDLFMEQIALCAIAGYTEIAQWRWLPRVIGWQRPGSGCYGTFPGEALGSAGDNGPGSYGNQRRKRTEAAMDGNGCLSHRTTVGLAALLGFVRRIVEDVLLQRLGS